MKNSVLYSLLYIIIFIYSKFYVSIKKIDFHIAKSSMQNFDAVRTSGSRLSFSSASRFPHFDARGKLAHGRNGVLTWAVYEIVKSL